MNEAELVALSDAGYHELERETILRSGGQVEEHGGVLHFAGTHDAPFVVNGSIRMDPSVAADAVIEAAREWAARRGRTAGITTHAHDADIDAAVEAAGWELAVELPGMIATDAVDEGVPGPGVRIVPVRAESERHALISVLGQSFGPEEPWPSLWGSVFSDLSIVERPDTTAVVAFADDEPAAAAVAYALEPVGVVGMVGTISRFGRRGLGELVTRHVTAAAQRRTGRPVVLQSSPMARPLYERIGFRAVTRYRMWVDGPS